MSGNMVVCAPNEADLGILNTCRPRCFVRVFISNDTLLFGLLLSFIIIVDTSRISSFTVHHRAPYPTSNIISFFITYLKPTISTMVQVRLRTSRSAGRAGSGFRQSSHDSEDGVFTPLSFGPESSRDGQATPRTEFSFRFSPDTPLPSVEHPSASVETYSVETLSTSVAQIPSVSVSPPGSVSRHTPNPVTTRRDDTINVVETQLREMRLSAASAGPSMNLSDVSTALREVIAGRDSRSSPLLDPEPRSSISPSPGKPNAHRRRSSSRTPLPKHDVRDEAPPNDRFNTPGFQKSLRDTKRSMTKLVDVLGSSAVGNEPDSVMERLHSEAKNLSQFECPSRRTVGFVGDSGAGKSSLLNSLLDYRDLARSSNGGGACTAVVTEFQYHEDERFTIKVERFSEDELMPQLKSLLRDYRHFHLNRDSFNSQEEVIDLEKRAGIARDTFQAMFPGDFAAEATFIHDTESQSLSTLKSWVRNFDQSIIQEIKSELNLDKCSSLLMQLSSVTTSERPLWPWIKKIIVYSNAHILGKGLILVDLPGLRDLNAARRNITERYLLRCNEIFVVAAEGRATTDEGVQSVIELAKNAQLSNVGIICTRSDEIDPTEALKDWKGKQAAREIQQKREAIERENSNIDDLEEQLKDFDDIDRNDMEAGDKEELSRIQWSLRMSRKTLSSCEFDLQGFLITTRNAIIRKKLIEQYQGDVPGNSLKVFCASNTLYRDWRGKPVDEAMPRLILSGILNIRQHCMSMVSESQYVAAKKYMRDDIGVLLGELDLWVQSGQGSLSAERKASIRSTLDTLERKLDLELRGRMSGLHIVNAYKREFDTKLYRPQGERLGRWSAAARDASDDWSCWHHSSYAAFCRNYGNHCTAKIGPRDWNQEIIEEMTNDLNPPWEQLQMTLDQKAEEIMDFIDHVFDEADGFLDNELDDFLETARPIASTLVSKKRVIEADIQVILDNLEGDLRTLRADALSSIRTSFIGKAMEKAYENARRESGGGSDARRKAIINSAVRRAGLFNDILKSFKTDFNGYVEDTDDCIQDVVSSHFDAIKDTFDIIRNDNAALECEKDPEFRGRVERRVAATREEMKEVYDVIAS
ncbi:hypothetical protein F4678DRAFT_417505 [Xylaria arbuscula]|nr:hypothetical protein F4678DRAFT_417505 [Xylaria arbuscula]